MSVDEQARHGLHRAIADTIGEDHAATLMSLLPPVGWADVATKTDLRALEQTMDTRFDAMDIRFDAMDRRFEAVEGRLDNLDRLPDRLDRLGDRLDAFHRELRFMVIAALSLAVAAAGMVAGLIA